MRTRNKTVQVIGAIILAAFAVFAVGCQKDFSVDPTGPGFENPSGSR